MQLGSCTLMRMIREQSLIRSRVADLLTPLSYVPSPRPRSAKAGSPPACVPGPRRTRRSAIFPDLLIAYEGSSARLVHPGDPSLHDPSCSGSCAS